MTSGRAGSTGKPSKCPLQAFARVPSCVFSAEARWAWGQFLARAAYMLDLAVGSVDSGDTALPTLCVRAGWSSWAYITSRGPRAAEA